LTLQKLKFLKQDLKKYIGRKLAARVLNTWHEDFVDEDTEVVSIERNEIILDRDTIIDKDNVEEIIDSNVKSILLHKKMLIKLIMLSFIIRYKRSNKL
jgi:DNA-directed RNA polymerase subunit beta